jgi:hypothetical protein
MKETKNKFMKVKGGPLRRWKGKEKGPGIRKCYRRGECGQSTLYECIEVT